MHALGAILAGGAGRRIGGAKAVVGLRGEPLLHYPLAALREVLDDVVVIAKEDSELPDLARRARIWTEPAEPRHPLTGIVHALRVAGGRPVLVVAADLPLLDAATLRRILATDPEGALAVVPRAAGRLQSLCALYLPGALAPLSAAGPAARLTDAVERLGVRVLEEPDPTPYFNVNTPDDLLQAAAILDERDRAERAART